MKNRPTYDEVASSPELLNDLALDVIDDLCREAEQAGDTANAAKRAISEALLRRFEEPATALYRAENKDFGTVRVNAGSHELVVNRAKKIEWDQSRLATTVAAIRAAGDDPTEYVDTSFSVPERKYAAWPAHIREQFEPARTVKPGAVSAKLQPLQKAA